MSIINGELLLVRVVAACSSLESVTEDYSDTSIREEAFKSSNWSSPTAAATFLGKKCMRNPYSKAQVFCTACAFQIDAEL